MAGEARAAADASLARLRWRLTAWYAATFLAILVLLGVGLFAAITRRFDADLDASLRQAVDALAGVTRQRGPQAATSLIIPGRRLVLFDDRAQPVAPDSAPPWLGELASHVASADGVAATHQDGETLLRARLKPFAVAAGRRYVAAAYADEVEVEDRYGALIALTGAAAVVATLLVGAGGWLLARKSIDPVERAMTQMRRFMADAAHELRTPLSVVRGRAEVTLQRQREPAEYVDALRGIEQESIRVGRIVEDLLMLARADAGERPIERRRCFLDDVALDAAEAARALADRKQIRLQIDELDEAPVNGDPGLLRQLVLILLDNAIKFSPVEARVTVAVRRRGAVATLVVSDDGPGIAPEHLPHVFERFYRGDAARPRGDDAHGGVSNGAGLGLSIGQWIAREHGAVIRLESAAGEGTTATVEFPSAGDLSSS